MKDIKKLELDPNKKYLLIIDKSTISERTAANLAGQLRDQDFSLTILLTPDINGIKVVEEKI